MRKAVFLDRDGTIIIDKIYLNSVNEIEYLPNAIEGLRAMRNLGFEFVIATNQSGIARGLVSIENLFAIHAKIREDLSREGLDVLGFYYAPYAVDSGHPLRKPSPGMLLEGARDFGIDLKKSWMIGDRMSDIEAGFNAGTRAILLTTGGAREKSNAVPTGICKDLVEAAALIGSHPLAD